MSRAEAVAHVRRIMDVDHATEAEADACLEALDRALGCPSGYVSDLIYWPPEHELTADEVVDRALAYRAIAL
ncbi:e9imm peptide [Streptomyces sp. NPDC057682]|uniref:e9imm peptide n=1 Tax=Streptomyces sp. NPDC057682 TaxID=3346210 RepID=UPI0036B40DE3